MKNWTRISKDAGRTYRVRFLSAVALFVLTSPAQAGETKPETTLMLAGQKPDAVSRWIAEHADQLEEAAGASVVSHKGDYVKLRKPDQVEGEPDSVFICRRAQEPGKLSDVLVRRISGRLTACAIRVEVAAARDGSEVKIRLEATAEGLQAAKMAVGARRAVRGIARVLDEGLRASRP
jgi:hypothetical protein